jgi:hypothetical protein
MLGLVVEDIYNSWSVRQSQRCYDDVFMWTGEFIRETVAELYSYTICTSRLTISGKIY